MTPFYEPICEQCNSEGVIRLATEERSTIPLCAEHAQAEDEREPPEPDLSGPTYREQSVHETEQRSKDRGR